MHGKRLFIIIFMIGLVLGTLRRLAFAQELPPVGTYALRRGGQQMRMFVRDKNTFDEELTSVNTRNVNGKIYLYANVTVCNVSRGKPPVFAQPGGQDQVAELPIDRNLVLFGGDCEYATVYAPADNSAQVKYLGGTKTGEIVTYMASDGVGGFSQRADWKDATPGTVLNEWHPWFAISSSDGDPELPIVAEDGRLFTFAWLNEKPSFFAIDTGATSTMADFSRFGIQATDTGTIELADGTNRPVLRGEASLCYVASLCITVPFTSEPKGESVLGLSFFKLFDEVIFDINKGYVKLAYNGKSGPSTPRRSHPLP